MAHHAYLFTGDLEEGVRAARSFAAHTFNIEGEAHPDIALFSFGLLTVEDARRIGVFSLQAPVAGDTRLIVLATGRLYHEAQNALLKLFEEPNPGTVLILIVPTAGILLPTLRSRLVPLPHEGSALSHDTLADTFLAASATEREKLIAKLLARTKADAEEDKQAARLEVISLVEGLTAQAYTARKSGNNDPRLLPFLSDLSRFIPILHERSPAYKPILEHLLITIPDTL